MTRLLTGDDLEYLKAQKGYRPEIGEKFRRDRARMFRLYLADLAVDFRSLHAIARELVANAGAENADLVGSLLPPAGYVSGGRCLAIELRLTTGGMGFDSSLATDVRSLIRRAGSDTRRHCPASMPVSERWSDLTLSWTGTNKIS